MSAVINTASSGPATPPALNVSPAAMLMRQRSHKQANSRRSHLLLDEDSSVQITDESGQVSERSNTGLRTRRGLGTADASTERPQRSRRGMIEAPVRERSRARTRSTESGATDAELQA